MQGKDRQQRNKDRRLFENVDTETMLLLSEVASSSLSPCLQSLSFACSISVFSRGRYMSLTPSPWTTKMDYRNGLPKWTAKWTTKMDYPKLPTLKNKKITKAWLF